MLLNEMATLKYKDNTDVVIDGVKLSINSNDHNPPHIHGRKNGEDIYIELDGFKSQTNSKSLNQVKKDIVEWMMKNLDELYACFEEAQNNPTKTTFIRNFINENINSNEIVEMVPLISGYVKDNFKVVGEFNCGLSFELDLSDDVIEISSNTNYFSLICKKIVASQLINQGYKHL